MNGLRAYFGVAVASLALTLPSCASDPPAERSPDALATALSPQLPPEHYVRRARDFWPTYLQAAQEAGPDYHARGCGWVE